MAIYRGPGGSGDATTDAASQATVATTKAAEAAASASAASSSASAAATSASNASTSAGNAETYKNEAETAKIAAELAETNAETAQTAAEAALDSFDDRYLGAKASDPTLDNDGDALITGALYFNTVSNVMFTYTGSAWQTITTGSGGLQAANNLNDVADASTSRTNLGVAIGTDVQAHSAVLDATTASYTTAEETKLAGIEASATADQTAGEIKTAYESNADTNAFTDAQVTKLAGIETAADVTDVDNVTAAGALMDSELTSEASVKALNQGVATTDSPSFAGLTVDTDTLYVDSTNNRIGVRTNTPSVVFDVDGPANFNGRIRNNDGGSAASPSIQPGLDGDTGIFHPATNTIGFSTTGSEAMRIDSTGNVGIGTSSPSRQLHIKGSASAVRLEDTDQPSVYHEIIENSGQLDIRADHGNTSTTGNMLFSVGGSEYMRIDSAGNVGIGTTNPAATVDVNGNARGAVTTDNDLSFDLSATNNFSCTPTGAGTLTFTNHLAGQSGFVLLDNSGGHAIAAAATTKINAADLTAISTAGVYTLSYFDNGTNAYVSVSRSFA